jgi:hypothetical protein
MRLLQEVRINKRVRTIALVVRHFFARPCVAL